MRYNNYWIVVPYQDIFRTVSHWRVCLKETIHSLNSLSLIALGFLMKRLYLQNSKTPNPSYTHSPEQ